VSTLTHDRGVVCVDGVNRHSSRSRSFVDGAIRLTLDIPEDAIEQAAWLMECKSDAKSLHVACLINKENIDALREMEPPRKRGR